jgi:hypothetical protein
MEQERVGKGEKPTLPPPWRLGGSDTEIVSSRGLCNSQLVIFRTLSKKL